METPNKEVLANICDIIMNMPVDNRVIAQEVKRIVQGGNFRPSSPVSQTNNQLLTALYTINNQIKILQIRGAKAPKPYIEDLEL